MCICNKDCTYCSYFRASNRERWLCEESGTLLSKVRLPNISKHNLLRIFFCYISVRYVNVIIYYDFSAIIIAIISDLCIQDKLY